MDDTWARGELDYLRQRAIDLGNQLSRLERDLARERERADRAWNEAIEAAAILGKDFMSGDISANELAARIRSLKRTP